MLCWKRIKSEIPTTMLVNKIKAQEFYKQQSKKAVNNIVLGNIISCNRCKKDFERGGKVLFM